MKDYPKTVFMPTSTYEVAEYEVLSVNDQRRKGLYVKLKDKKTDWEIQGIMSSDWKRLHLNLVFKNQSDAKAHVMEKLEEQIKITESQLENLKSKRDVLSYNF